MQYEIKAIPLSAVRDNPDRDTERFPLSAAKVDALKKSIEGTGLWPASIIVRDAGDDTYELAFGHHRVAAAREVLGDDYEHDFIVCPQGTTEDEMLMLMLSENSSAFSSEAQHLVLCVEKIVEMFERIFEKYPTYDDAKRSGHLSGSFLERCFGPDGQAQGKYAHLSKEGVGRALVVKFANEQLTDREVRPIIAIMKSDGGVSMEAAARLPVINHIAAFAAAVSTPRAKDAGLANNPVAQNDIVDGLLENYALSRNSADEKRKDGANNPKPSDSLTAKNVKTFIETVVDERILPTTQKQPPQDQAKMIAALENATARVKAATKQMADAKARLAKAKKSPALVQNFVELNMALEAFDATKNGLIRDAGKFATAPDVEASEA